VISLLEIIIGAFECGQAMLFILPSLFALLFRPWQWWEMGLAFGFSYFPFGILFLLTGLLTLKLRPVGRIMNLILAFFYLAISLFAIVLNCGGFFPFPPIFFISPAWPVVLLYIFLICFFMLPEVKKQFKKE
jgi:hypothetical protein